MRWNIGSSLGTITTPIDSSLPPDHPPVPSSSRLPPPSCPLHQSQRPTTPTTATSGPAKCPIQHDTPSSLNPLNSIPKNLSSDRAPGQVLDLPTERTASSIPRPNPSAGEDESSSPSGRWEYPSPQQFYNALVRKGWETPEESIEMVVAIHNFLNEKAWDEVMKWEKRLPGGDAAQLARFQGRPGELSPKARLHLWAGNLFPSRFNTEPPFDRHDWIVTRPDPSSTSTPPQTSTTRYVIDYYSAPPDQDGNPVFHLDVRPALDSLRSVNERIRVGVEEWMRGQDGDGQ